MTIAVAKLLQKMFMLHKNVGFGLVAYRDTDVNYLNLADLQDLVGCI